MTETVRRHDDLARIVAKLKRQVDSLPIHTHSTRGPALLASQDATSGTVTFTNVSQIFTHLRVVWHLRTDTAGGNRIDLRLLDSGGNHIGANNIDSYLVQFNGDGTRTDTYASAAGTNYRAGHAGNTRRSQGELLIPDYSGSETKGFTGSGTSYGTTAAALSNWQCGGETNGTATIHEVSLQVIGGNFAAGTVWLYGSD